MQTMIGLDGRSMKFGFIVCEVHLHSQPEDKDETCAHAQPSARLKTELPFLKDKNGLLLWPRVKLQSSWTRTACVCV